MYLHKLTSKIAHEFFNEQCEQRMLLMPMYLPALNLQFLCAIWKEEKNKLQVNTTSCVIRVK